VLAYNRALPSASSPTSGGWQRYFFTAIGIGAALYIVYLLRKHSASACSAGPWR
jgi:signal peptidase II